jgi:hypothetical protein
LRTHRVVPPADAQLSSEVSELSTTIASLQAERDSMVAEIADLEVQRDSLRTSLDELIEAGEAESPEETSRPAGVTYLVNVEPVAGPYFEAERSSPLGPDSTMNPRTEMRARGLQ